MEHVQAKSTGCCCRKAGAVDATAAAHPKWGCCSLLPAAAAHTPEMGLLLSAAAAVLKTPHTPETGLLLLLLLQSWCC